jgi:hypothetical protein
MPGRHQSIVDREEAFREAVDGLTVDGRRALDRSIIAHPIDSLRGDF